MCGLKGNFILYYGRNQLLAWYCSEFMISLSCIDTFVKFMISHFLLLLLMQPRHWEDSLGCFRRTFGVIIQRWRWTLQGSNSHIWCPSDSLDFCIINVSYSSFDLINSTFFFFQFLLLYYVYHSLHTFICWVGDFHTLSVSNW